MPLHTRRLSPIAVAALTIALIGPAAGDTQLQAQNRMRFPIAADDGGHVALGLAIRKLNVAGTFMQCPAHPDDETNSLFALYGYGMGVRVIDVQNNRGEGGQNEIGPELFREMGVLRTSELLSAHRIDGAEQFFTRAIDYGYSWDPNEVIQKWGRDEIVGDYVRLIRTLRPDVIVTMNIQGGGGDRAHEATTILAREAYRAAGDPNRYPDQLREGLRPWHASKLYFSGGGGGGRGGRGGAGRGAGGAGAPGAPPNAPATPGGVARIDTAVFDPLLGRTYAEIGSDARCNHKCQGVGCGGSGGFGGGRGGPGGGAAFTLMDTTIQGQMNKDESSLLEGVDVSLTGLAKYAGASPPAALLTGLEKIAMQALQAKQAFDTGSDAATAAPIETGLAAVRALRAQLGSMALGDSARYEIDFRLKNKEKDWQDAVIAAHGLTFQAVANDGLVVAGQPIQVAIGATNRGGTEVTVSDVSISGFDNPSACAGGPVKKDAAFSCITSGNIPASAKLTEPYFTDKYWQQPANPARNDFDPSVPFGVPFAPTPFRVAFHLKAGSVEVTKDVSVEYRYVKDIYFGDKRMELNVVPAFSVKVSPGLAVFPAQSAAAAKAKTHDVFVSVTNGTKGAAKAMVALQAPAGWKVTPASAVIEFQNEDQALSARFQLGAPAGAKIGAYTIRAVVTSETTGAQPFANGYQEIDYPHIQRRQVIKPAEAIVKVLDVKTLPGIKVGYIMGVGDQVPAAIEQLGAKVSFIESDELAWGDLSKYDVIMTGVRAYERRADLRASNRRLLDYAEHGGTVLVNYNKTEFNAGAGRGGGAGGPGGRAAGPPSQGGYGPYPALVSGSRVNDETVPVKVLVPSHPVFNFPNKIGPATWANWVQERGQYFLDQKDPKYADLVSMVDSFPDNPGEKLGSLVDAKFGKGHWMYLGLGLWRQLPAGTDGAYQLLANLLALPRADLAVPKSRF